MEPTTVFKWDSKPIKENPLCCGQCPYKLLTPSVRLLPFQVIATSSLATPQTFNVTHEDNTVTTLPISLIKSRTFTTAKYFYYEGELHGETLKCGFYTATLVDSLGVTYYSDKFYVMGAVFSENLAPLLGTLTFSANWTDTVNGWCKIAGTVETITVPGILTTGKMYKVVVGYTVHQAQAFTIDIGGGSSTSHVATNMAGVFEFTGVAGASPDVVISSTALNNLCVSMVKVYEVQDNIGQCNYHLRWRNCTQVGGTIFANTLYYEEFFIDAESEIYNRTPKTTTEVQKQSDGSEKPIFQRIEYSQDLFLGRMPDNVATALAAIPLHDTIELIGKDTSFIREIQSTTINSLPVEDTQYCFTDVSLNFQYDDALVVTSCCDGELLETEELSCIAIARYKFDPNFPILFQYLGTYFPGANTVSINVYVPTDPDYITAIITAAESGVPTLSSLVEQYDVKVINDELIFTMLVKQSQLSTSPRGMIIFDSNVGQVDVPFIYECCNQARRYNWDSGSGTWHIVFTPNGDGLSPTNLCSTPYRTILTLHEFVVDGVDLTPVLNTVEVDFNLSFVPTNATETPVPTLLGVEYDTVNNFMNSITPLIQFSEGLMVIKLLDENTTFKIAFSVQKYHCNGAGVLTITQTPAGWPTPFNSYGGGTIYFTEKGTGTTQGFTQGGYNNTDPKGYEAHFNNCIL